jgi:Protein of unknown function (DUF1559)
MNLRTLTFAKLPGLCGFLPIFPETGWCATWVRIAPMSETEYFWARFAAGLPSLLAYLVGLVLAVAYWRRHPRVSLLILILCVVCIARWVGQPFAYRWLFQRLQAESQSVRDMYFLALDYGTAVLAALLFGLLLLAGFGWRDQTRRTSVSAVAGFFLGLLALCLSALAGMAVGLVPSLGVVAVAALPAVGPGVLGLWNVRLGQGSVKGTGLAITGMAAALLGVAPPLLVNGLVKPAIEQKTRKLASSNHLKELGLAMLYWTDEHGRRMPPAVFRDPGGQPYSWRVALLPYLGEKELYLQYRRDEPWDSAANKAVLARMPRVFAPPGRPADGLTYYQVFVGPGTAFDSDPQGVRHPASFPGAAKTICVIEAGEPVPWTKPQDLTYAPDRPLPRLGGLVGPGFHAMFADASVRWIEEGETDKAIRSMIVRTK